jgi:outer membrane protein TolC
LLRRLVFAGIQVDARTAQAAAHLSCRTRIDGVVLHSVEARYKLGDASLADVLQKRRDWNATQTSYLQSLREVHDSWRALSLITDTDRRSE